MMSSQVMETERGKEESTTRKLGPEESDFGLWLEEYFKEIEEGEIFEQF